MSHHPIRWRELGPILALLLQHLTLGVREAGRLIEIDPGSLSRAMRETETPRYVGTAVKAIEALAKIRAKREGDDISSLSVREDRTFAVPHNLTDLIHEIREPVREPRREFVARVFAENGVKGAARLGQWGYHADLGKVVVAVHLDELWVDVMKEGSNRRLIHLGDGFNEDHFRGVIEDALLIARSGLKQPTSEVTPM